MPRKPKLSSPPTVPGLFIEKQSDLLEKSFQEEQEARINQPIECLGISFPNDEARREHFLGLLAEKLKDPEFRKIEGFPVGNDKDILLLSDPPYYTACPNPWEADFVKCYGSPYDASKTYHREPFATDVSEGKTHPIYLAHSYHTKVPHRAIMRYILHYTQPGDLILDSFAGTGMTGVAATLCGNKQEVQALGCLVDGDGTITGLSGGTTSKLGARHALLNDLSPVASFIAYNYNNGADSQIFEGEARKVLREIETECGWMYETEHTDGSKAPINFTVWSDVFVCPECGGEVVFWEEAISHGNVSDKISCPHCKANLTKRSMTRAVVTEFDATVNATVKKAKRKPALISYNYGGKRLTKKPDSKDLQLLEQISRHTISRFAQQWLMEDEAYPLAKSLQQNLLAKGIREYDLSTLSVFCEGFFRLQPCFQDQVAIRDILYEDAASDPEIKSTPRLPKTSTEAANNLVILALLDHCGCRLSSGSFALQTSIEASMVSISAQIHEVEHSRTDLESLAEMPQTIKGKVTVCSSLEELAINNDEGVLLLDAADDDQLRLCIKLAIYRSRLLRNITTDWVDLPHVRIGQQFRDRARTVARLKTGLPSNILDCIVNVYESINERLTHALRTGSGGDNPQRRSGGFGAWRRDIANDVHLHYWKGGEGLIELAWISHPHNDFEIPDPSGG